MRPRARFPGFANRDGRDRALRYPVTEKIGNRNALRGPSFWNSDISVLRTSHFRGKASGFRFGGRCTTPSPPAFGLLSAAFDTTGFGQVTTSATTRRAKCSSLSDLNSSETAIRYRFNSGLGFSREPTFFEYFNFQIMVLERHRSPGLVNLPVSLPRSP